MVWDFSPKGNTITLGPYKIMTAELGILPLADKKAQGKYWCATLNNYTEGEEAKVKTFFNSSCQYGVFGKEVGGKTNTPHLQIFFITKTNIRWSAITKLFPRIHVEKMKGTKTEASVYCKKKDTAVIYEVGELGPERGVAGGEAIQERWADVRDLTRAGNLDQVAEQYPQIWISHYRTLEYIMRRHQPNPDALNDVCGWWIHGPANGGKSHAAKDIVDPLQVYNKDTTKWWDGYTNEEHVVIDDFEPENAKPLKRYIKIWADKWAFPAENKNGSAKIRPKRLVVTSNFTIEECFHGCSDIDAIKRRFKVIYWTVEMRGHKLFE